MSIVTISRDAYSHGKEIAESVATQLGYDCVGPETIQTDSRKMDSGIEYIKAIGVPARRSLANYRAAFFEKMVQNNIVYHGLAGHVLLDEIPNVLRIRLVADFEERVREAMERTGESSDAIRNRLMREDEQMKRWADRLYGNNQNSPQLYDMTLNLQHIGLDTASHIIADAVKSSSEDAEAHMQNRLSDLLLEARVEARLLESFAEVDARVQNGKVYASVQASIVQEEAVINRARAVLSDIEGIDAVHVGVAASEFVPF